MINIGLNKYLSYFFWGGVPYDKYSIIGAPKTLFLSIKAPHISPHIKAKARIRSLSFSS